MVSHISFEIFSLFRATLALFFHSFSMASRSVAVTYCNTPSVNMLPGKYAPRQTQRTERVSKRRAILRLKLTFFALPFLNPSSLASISALSVSSACTFAIKSAVLSVEFREDKVPRRVLAVALSVVVCARRSRIAVSRAASCSVVQASAAF